MVNTAKTIYVSAIYVSRPGTMGGNTKILIELINNLYSKYNIVVFTAEPETFRNGINKNALYTLVSIPYKFRKYTYTQHLKEITYVYSFYRDYFKRVSFSQGAYFYSASDFAPDVVPIFLLKKSFEFNWVCSLYLFIPSPWDNIREKYKFPFVKYCVYFLYQRLLFSIMIRNMSLCLVTNDSDRSYFPPSLQRKILALYGGVNIDQVIEAQKQVGHRHKEYDAVFCGRLHPQKGICQLLDIWKQVTIAMPHAKLCVIGNGEPSFERSLKKKCLGLGLNRNVVWMGYINNIEKYTLYLKSRLFVHPTVYDNNGMVAAEALCTGLPVIMYNLPTLHFYNIGCVKVPIGNKNEFAATVVNLLQDAALYKRTAPSKNDLTNLRYLWSWENRAKIVSDFLNAYENGLI